MAFFGEYLVSKGHIKPEALVDALIEQTKESPSIAEVARNQQLYSDEDFLNIFSVQSKKNTDFKSAAIELNLWSPEVEQKVDSEIIKTRTPIGQILTKRKAISFDVLTKALDDFLGTLKEPEPTTSPSATIAPSSEPLPSINPSTESLTTTGFTFHKIDPSLAAEYCDFVDPAQLQRIVSSVNTIPSENLGEPDASGLLKELLHSLHRMKGMARCVRASISEILLEEMQKVILSALKNPSSFSPDKIKTFKDQCLIALEIILQIRDLIRSQHSEEGAMSDPVLKQMIPESIKLLEGLK